MRHGCGLQKSCLEVRFFSDTSWADLDLIVNAERFAQIDQINRIYDYECNQCVRLKKVTNKDI